MTQDILVVHGLTQTSDWYLTDLKKSAVLAASGAKLHLVDFDYGNKVQDVARALDSGRFKSVIMCDLSAEQNKFTSLLGATLKRFTGDFGGKVAFPTTEGLLLVDVLQAIYNVPWKAAAYYRTEWGCRASAKERVDRDFPVKQFVKDGKAASEMLFSAKACSFLNVSKEDRCFGVVEESEHQSLSMLLTAAEKPAMGTATADEPEGRSEESHVSVATRRFGNGCIAFFGDVNCEQATADLVMAFCLA